jgi:hypothetical protein
MPVPYLYMHGYLALLHLTLKKLYVSISHYYKPIARCSQIIFPATDLDIFTSGIIPDDDGSLLHFIQGVKPALKKTGMSINDVLSLTETALIEALDGKRQAKQQPGKEMYGIISKQLNKKQLSLWQSPSYKFLCVLCVSL